MSSLRPAAGFSLLEVMFTAALVAAAAAWALPPAFSTFDDMRTLGAVRYLVGRLHRTRMEAVARGAGAGVRFTPAGPSHTYAAYGDGNGNGVRAADIQSGVDRRIDWPERLPDQFPGVDFGALPGLPPVEGSVPPGTDPVRCGSSDTITFTPAGTATPGSLYIRSRRGAQYAIRVFGQTGKVRILKFDPARRTWRSL